MIPTGKSNQLWGLALKGMGPFPQGGVWGLALKGMGPFPQGGLGACPQWNKLSHN